MTGTEKGTGGVHGGKGLGTKTGIYRVQEGTGLGSAGHGIAVCLCLLPVLNRVPLYSTFAVPLHFVSGLL